MQVIDVQQIIYAMERAEQALEAQATQLGDQGDYSAEFPAEDAERMREGIRLLRAAHNPRIPMPQVANGDAVLPYPVKIGHVTFGKGVGLSSLIGHAKRLYQFAHGRDADEVANEPLEARKARGDAFLASLRLPTGDNAYEQMARELQSVPFKSADPCGCTGRCDGRTGCLTAGGPF